MDRTRRLLIGLISCHSLVFQESSARPPLSPLPVSESARIDSSGPLKQPAEVMGGSNACPTAEAISGTGVFSFDNTEATTDGPVHLSCGTLGGDEQIVKDLWYCWTATCTKQVLARTCGSTQVDTKIAVYEGCTCPVTDGNLLDCDDDRCAPFQSVTAFDAIAGHQYLIRVGSYPGEPGGEGAVTISCGPPNHASCPAAGDCCTGHTQPGACSDETCCETVCLCDPFCCTTEWDEACAGNGFNESGCGAAELCPNLCIPGCVQGSPCTDDGLECTQDLCMNGVCEHPPLSAGTTCIDDGDACTTDVCDGNGTCTHTVNGPCGACCSADLSCEDGVPAAQCHSMDGYFYPSNQCADNPCTSVPTVSEWGLIILVLLAFLAARFVFDRPAQQHDS